MLPNLLATRGSNMSKNYDELDAMLGAKAPGAHLDDFDKKLGAVAPKQNPADVKKDDPIQMIKDGVRGLVQGLSLGFADEGNGASNAVREIVRPSPGNEGKGILDRASAGYVAGRDFDRNENATAQQRSPVAFGAGQVAGSVAPIIATGGVGGAATGVTAGARVLNAAASGAKLGAVTGLGNAEGDLGDQAAQTANSALLGGAVSGGLAAAGPIVGRGFDKIKGALGLNPDEATALARGGAALKQGRINELQSEIAKPDMNLSSDVMQKNVTNAQAEIESLKNTNPSVYLKQRQEGFTNTAKQSIANGESPQDVSNAINKTITDSKQGTLKAGVQGAVSSVNAPRFGAITQALGLPEVAGGAVLGGISGGLSGHGVVNGAIGGALGGEVLHLGVKGGVGAYKGIQNNNAIGATSKYIAEKATGTVPDALTSIPKQTLMSNPIVSQMGKTAGDTASAMKNPLTFSSIFHVLNQTDPKFRQKNITDQENSD
jgi:hypothetical protein